MISRTKLMYQLVKVCIQEQHQTYLEVILEYWEI